ncbi:MAG TPA: hypothetical protein PKN00_17315, partial [Sedimentisphaerales bacterium]|nr:hypothetical protein [Sedimentisphaerales bacterium]
RIIKDRCGDPRVGARWMAGVGLLAILAVVSVGFAQRRPVTQDKPRGGVLATQPAPEQRAEPATDWQREVVQRKLGELAGQIEDKETLLRENRDLPPEERRVQEFELGILYEMAAQLERRLGNLDRPESRTARRQASENELALRRDELEGRLQTLRATANLMERNLRQDDTMNPDVRHDLEVRLDKTRQEILQIEDEFRIVERRQQTQNPTAEQPRVVETRRRRGGSDPYGGAYGVESPGDAIYGVRKPVGAERDRNRAETRVYALDRPNPDKMRAILQILSQLPETTVTPIADGKLAVATTAENHLRIEGIIQNFDREEPPLDVQVQDLRSQMQGLQEQMQQMQKLLEQLAQRGPRTETPADAQEPRRY